MTHKWILPVGLSILSLGCGGSKSSNSNSTITIGALTDLTGVYASTGTDEFQAATLAVEEINAQGGVLGQQLKLERRDDGSSETKGVTAAKELIDLGAQVMVGPVSSGVMLAMAPEIVAAKRVIISGASTSPAITSFADDGYLFRTIPSDALQGKLLAERAYTTHAFRKVAVIFVPNAYGQGLADAFETNYSAMGGALTKKVAYVEGKSESDYSAVLADVFATNPEAIVLLAYPDDGAKIVRAYNNNFSSKNTFFFFSDGVEDVQAFITPVGAGGFTFLHEGTGGGIPTGGRFQTFLTAYTKRWGQTTTPGNDAANVYDAVYLAALSMSAGGKTDGTTIRDNLVAVSKGGTVYGPNDFKAAAAAAAAGKDIDYDGASGNCDLDDKGDPLTGIYDVWQVKNGNFEAIASGISP